MANMNWLHQLHQTVGLNPLSVAVTRDKHLGKLDSSRLQPASNGRYLNLYRTHYLMESPPQVQVNSFRATAGAKT